MAILGFALTALWLLLASVPGRLGRGAVWTSQKLATMVFEPPRSRLCEPPSPALLTFAAGEPRVRRPSPG